MNNKHSKQGARFSEAKKFAFRNVAALIESSDLEQLFADKHPYSDEEMTEAQRLIILLLRGLGEQ